MTSPSLCLAAGSSVAISASVSFVDLRGRLASGFNPVRISLRLDSLRRTDRNVEERHPELEVRGAGVADAMNVFRGLYDDLSRGVCRARAVVLVERELTRLDGHDRGTRMQVPTALAARTED